MVCQSVDNLHNDSLLFSHFSTAESTVLYTPISKKRCQRERRMAVVERKLHDRKELWFPYLACQKKINSSCGAKLILPYERPTGSGLTPPFTRNLEIKRSTDLSQMPEKNEASATEF